MQRPEVIVHNMISVDGRMDCAAGDVRIFYELVAKLPHDAVLCGSATMLAAAAGAGIDLDGEDEPPADRATAAGRSGDSEGDEDLPDAPPADAADRGVNPGAPLLVIVDSRGLLTRFDWLRAMPYWRDLVIACSAATPAAHLALLARHGVRYIVTGDDRVDLALLLDELAATESVTRVRVDSGGTLNGALLRAGLIDEVSMLVAPFVVGGSAPAPLFAIDALASGGLRLELAEVVPQRSDSVWLRYRVVTFPAA